MTGAPSLYRPRLVIRMIIGEIEKQLEQPEDDSQKESDRKGGKNKRYIGGRGVGL